MPSLTKLAKKCSDSSAAALSQLTKKQVKLFNELKSESLRVYSDGTLDNDVANDMLSRLVAAIDNIATGLAAATGVNTKRYSDVRGDYISSEKLRFDMRLASTLC